MTKVQSDASYKESGLAWLGKIPSHWEVVPSKWLFSLRAERASATDLHLMASQKYGVISQAQYMIEKDQRVVQTIVGGENMKRICSNDFLIHLRSFQGGIEWSANEGKVSPAYTVLSPSTGVHPRFFYYLLKSDGYIQELRSTTNQLRDGQSMNYSQFAMIPLMRVPLHEQKSIADFLDRETAQIDDLIGKQERLAELLAEKRQAVITQAVTKGLDPSAPTKPSGIPWLGQVPIQWSVPKLGMHSRIGNGSTPSRENLAYWTEGTIPWLNSSHVNRDEVTDSDQFITDLAAAECHLPRVAKGDLVVGLTGQGRTRGMTSIVRFETTINQHLAYVAASGKHWNSEYLLLFLRAAYDQLRELSDENGSTKGALTCAALKNLSVCLPPLSEQTAIVAAVNRTLARIDGITLASKKAIDLLRERRSVLISAAVTGKIDVREGVA